MHGGSLEDATLQKNTRFWGEHRSPQTPLHAAPAEPCTQFLYTFRIGLSAIGYRAIGYRLSVETRGHNNPKSEVDGVAARVVPVPRPAENICAILVV